MMRRAVATGLVITAATGLGACGGRSCEKNGVGDPKAGKNEVTLSDIAHARRSSYIGEKAIELGRQMQQLQAEEGKPKVHVRRDPRVRGGRILEVWQRVDSLGCNNIKRVAVAIKGTSAGQTDLNLNPANTYEATASVERAPECAKEDKKNEDYWYPGGIVVARGLESYTDHGDRIWYESSEFGRGQELHDGSSFNNDCAAENTVRYVQEMYHDIAGEG